MEEEEAILRGQAQVWDMTYSYTSTMVLKCVVELHIPDIIQANGGQMTIEQIGSKIKGFSTENLNFLARTMRMAVRLKLFSRHQRDESGETVYGLTRSSKWLINDKSENSMWELVVMNHPWLWMPWHCLGNSVKMGENAFSKVHGRQYWHFASEDPQFLKLTLEGFSCSSRITMKSILSEYKDGFNSLTSLVDLGGGSGEAAAAIVKSYPHIKVINFDSPQVIAKAPQREGVTHAGGSMFEKIPKADAVLLKHMLHDFSDKDCIKILKKCRHAVPKENGRVIIVEILLEPYGDGALDNQAVVYDVARIAYTNAGKERTKEEWKALLEKSGFRRFNFRKIPDLRSIIEAFRR